MTEHTPTERPNIAGDPSSVEAEISDFQGSLGRFLDGKVPDAVFLEHRLRHGVYGMRQDGVHMMRSKLPLGLISPEQLEAFADVAQSFGHGIAHLTTRQDIQTHFIPLERTPDFMRVLARAEATSREACGNVVRNITASDVAGIDPAEAFDITPAGMALARYLLRIPDGQSLGRKFKITLSSSDDARFNLDSIHDIGVTGVIRDGQRGFRMKVGGGLGAVPHEAVVLYDFLPEAELLPVSHAILRVFRDHGEKKKRARARMKFVVARLGLATFRELVEEQRAQLPDDPVWTEWIRDDFWALYTDQPRFPSGGPLPQGRTPAQAQWLRTNVLKQKQPGYAAVKVRVPTGDLSPGQLRGLAQLLRAHTGDTLRVGADQSLRIRWVSTDKLLDVYEALSQLDLASPRAGGLGDTVTCPGADTCKLGITSPRSVARRMQPILDEIALEPRLEHLRIHISGCPNSCAQHQIGDIGLFGSGRTVGGRTVPHYALMLGGLQGGVSPQGTKLGSGFASPFAKLPAANVGEAVRRITTLFLNEGLDGEAFGAFARRVGRKRVQELLGDLTSVPSFDAAPHFYTEFGKEQESFEVKRGVGECAGEIVDLADLLLAEADREADKAVALFEDGGERGPVVTATWAAFDIAARAMLSTEGLTNPRAFDTVEAFRAHFYDSGRIFEGVGHYLLEAAAEDTSAVDDDRIRRRVNEAALFVEEAHNIINRLRAQRGAA